MRIEPFRPVLPNTELIASADTFFGVIKEHYLDYRERDMFESSEESGIFVYRLREAGANFLGLIAGVPNELYRNGTIKRHEGTLAASEQQQLQLLMLRQAMVKPVLLTYPSDPQIEDLLQEVSTTHEPLLKLTDGDAIEHELFRVEADSTHGQALISAFAKTVHSAYIADGHHRCSVLDIYNKQLEAKGEAPVPLMAALFSDEQVRVQAYHRVVQLPVNVSALSLMAQLSTLFEIKPIKVAALPSQPHELTMLLQDEAFRLVWRAGIVPEHGITLDAGLINELVMGPIFGITSVRTDSRISYVPGGQGMGNIIDRVQRRANRVGFMLYGLEARDMFAVVDAGMIMPPKSTWFEPRLRNGLVVMEV